MSKEPRTGRNPASGRAVDDEEPGKSVTDGLAMPVGPAQPYDVERVESDRAKSQSPRKTPADGGKRS